MLFLHFGTDLCSVGIVVAMATKHCIDYCNMCYIYETGFHKKQLDFFLKFCRNILYRTLKKLPEIFILFIPFILHFYHSFAICQ